MFYVYISLFLVLPKMDSLIRIKGDVGTGGSTIQSREARGLIFSFPTDSNFEIIRRLPQTLTANRESTGAVTNPFDRIVPILSLFPRKSPNCCHFLHLVAASSVASAASRWISRALGGRRVSEFRSQTSWTDGVLRSV